MCVSAGLNTYFLARDSQYLFFFFFFQCLHGLTCAFLKEIKPEENPTLVLLLDDACVPVFPGTF